MRDRFKHIVLLASLGALLTSTPVVASDDTAKVDSGPYAPLLSGMGVYSRPISTGSIAAQRFFDQGLALTYGYYFVHAVASFQEAIRHDPDCAMAYWGLAQAIGPNPNSRYALAPDDPQGAGKRAIVRAMQLRDNASEVERGLIEALYVRYDGDTYPDRGERDTAYLEAVRALHRAYPNDLEVGFLVADAIMTPARWDYWNEDGSPKPRTAEAVEVLERTVAAHPLHSGANHLYIHLVEASNDPGRATPHADRLASLSPNIGHIVHMPSHIFIRTGRYRDAIETNIRSAAMDPILLEEWGDHPLPMIATYNVSANSHTGHATDFVRFGATFEGNYAQAIEYARITSGKIAIDTVTNRNMRHVGSVWLVHKIFGKWDALAAEEAPPEDNAYLWGIWNYAQGTRHLREGNVKKAEEALTAIDEAMSRPEMETALIRVNPGKDVLAVALLGLQGEIAMERGQFDAAIRSFDAAARQERSLGYTEPPDWPQSMRLYLGNAYLKAGEPEKAEETFRADLEYWPENGWALFGLVQSLQAQGKDDEAAFVKARLEEAWKQADVELASPVF